MICIAAAGKTIVLAASAFTLSWTHSVEKTRWEERWLVEPGGLTVVEGRVEGSGAGMDPPPDAVLEDGAYVYRPDIAPLKQLILAASGATVSGWTLCPEGGECIELDATRGEPIVIEECSGDDEADAGTGRQGSSPTAASRASPD